MKKLVVLRSVTNAARKYADRHFRYFTWFDDAKTALASLKDGERPGFVVVDGSRCNASISIGPRAMGMGYTVQIKGVP